MKHYSSWKQLKQSLESFLCGEMKDRVTHFLTRYHTVHNAYGRAAVLLDGKEAARFSWAEGYDREYDLSERYALTGEYSPEYFKDKWNENCTYCDMNFLDAAVEFLNMPIREALKSDNYVIRIFAVLDRRVGKRTLQKIKDEGEYLGLPDWLGQFYRLRLGE